MLKSVRNIVSGVSLLGILFLASGAQAYTIFSGQDLGLWDDSRLTDYPNATAAQSDFLSNLIDVQVEDFESYSAGTTAPLILDFGVAGTATLAGTGVLTNLPTGSESGRYPTSGSKYWTSGWSFSFEFNSPVSVFGFLGTDVGDALGSMIMTLYRNGVGTDYFIDLDSLLPEPTGSVVFWGIIDVENPFTKAVFANSLGNGDWFGFDDMTIGSPDQVRVVPEPSTLSLLGFGLLGAIMLFRKSRS
jgi:hypothetical protein